MTYEQILTLSAGLMNDGLATGTPEKYTPVVLLPYLNIARLELQQIFQLNNIPVTDETSATITVPAGQEEIGFTQDAVGYAVLPSDLVEIQELLESMTGQNNFIPMTKREFLTPFAPGSTIEVAYFRIWSWQRQKIRVPRAVNDIDIKLNYVCKLFEFLVEGDLNDENNILSTDLFLTKQVAAHAANFIDHDDVRANVISGQAFEALQESLGISVKGMQPIFTRRRPFRAQFKTRRNIY